MEQTIRNALRNISDEQLHQLLSLIYDNKINLAEVESSLNKQLNFEDLLAIVKNLVDKKSKKRKKKFSKCSKDILINLLVESIIEKREFESFKKVVDNKTKNTNKLKN